MTLRYTPEAREDIRKIHSVIAEDLQNPSAAKRVISAILRDCAALKQFPKLGMSLAAKTGRKTDLYSLISGNYLAFYRIGEEYISITRILDGRADYLRHVF